MYDSYFDKGLEYFSDTDNLEKFTDEYKILGIEDKCSFKIDNYDFTGILDVECKRNEDNKFKVVDHKSKSAQDRKRLTKKDNPDDWVSTTDNRYIPRELINQQYIYAIPFKQKFNVYPDYLDFNMFRIKDWYSVEFNEDDFNKAKIWAINTIKDIYNEEEWKPTTDGNEFFCTYLCGCSTNCKYCSKYLG